MISNPKNRIDSNWNLGFEIMKQLSQPQCDDIPVLKECEIVTNHRSSLRKRIRPPTRLSLYHSVADGESLPGLGSGALLTSLIGDPKNKTLK